MVATFELALLGASSWRPEKRRCKMVVQVYLGPASGLYTSLQIEKKSGPKSLTSHRDYVAPGT
jgi:hypothetical protein